MEMDEIQPIDPDFLVQLQKRRKIYFRSGFAIARRLLKAAIIDGEVKRFFTRKELQRLIGNKRLDASLELARIILFSGYGQLMCNAWGVGWKVATNDYEITAEMMKSLDRSYSHDESFQRKWLAYCDRLLASRDVDVKVAAHGLRTAYEFQATVNKYVRSEVRRVRKIIANKCPPHVLKISSPAQEADNERQAAESMIRSLAHRIDNPHNHDYN